MKHPPLGQTFIHHPVLGGQGSGTYATECGMCLHRSVTEHLPCASSALSSEAAVAVADPQSI